MQQADGGVEESCKASVAARRRRGGGGRKGGGAGFGELLGFLCLTDTFY